MNISKITKVILSNYKKDPFYRINGIFRKCQKSLFSNGKRSSQTKSHITSKTVTGSLKQNKILLLYNTPGSRHVLYAQNSDAQNLDFCVLGTKWDEKNLGACSEFPRLFSMGHFFNLLNNVSHGVHQHPNYLLTA